MENTNQSIELVANKLDSYIAILAEKLGVAAEYVYPLFVKQQAIEAWTSIILSGGSFLIFVIIFILGVKRKETSRQDFNPKFFLILIGTLGLIISFFSVAICLESGIPKLLNPEYAAIQAIIQSIK